MKRLLLLLLVPCAAGITGCRDGAPVAEAAAGTSYARIAVKGMHCEMCASSVRGFLKKTDGVESSFVSVETGTVLVKFLPGRSVGDVVLKRAIYDAGFEATAVVRTSGDYARAVDDLKRVPAKS